MPSDVLDAVRKMVATAADERTQEHQRNNAAIKACKLIAEHKLLDQVQPTGVSAGDVLRFVDDLFARGDAIADRIRGATRGRGDRIGRRRYRR